MSLPLPLSLRLSLSPSLSSLSHSLSSSYAFGIPTSVFSTISGIIPPSLLHTLPFHRFISTSSLSLSISSHHQVTLNGSHRSISSALPSSSSLSPMTINKCPYQSSVVCPFVSFTSHPSTSSSDSPSISLSSSPSCWLCGVSFSSLSHSNLTNDSSSSSSNKHSNDPSSSSSSSPLYCPSCSTLQPSSLSTDYFTLFGLTPHFTIDIEDIEKKVKNIQKKLHPDVVEKQAQNWRISNSSPSSALSPINISHIRSVSSSLSSHLNIVSHILRDPYQRSLYLLSLNSMDLEGEIHGKQELTKENLMELEKLLEIREEIMDLNEENEEHQIILKKMKNDIDKEIQNTLHLLQQLYDKNQNNNNISAVPHSQSHHDSDKDKDWNSIKIQTGNLAYQTNIKAEIIKKLKL